MSSDNEDKMDMYGFSNNVTYDRKNDYPVLKPDISARKFAMYLVIGVLVFFLLFPVLNYIGKVRANNNLLESMKRLPEGATKMDYVSQTAVMSNRLRGGRGGGFAGGFFGGMLGGSMMGRRR